MRVFPFKVLLVLVVLPPLLYVAAIQGLERYLTYYYRGQIIGRIPGDTQALLSGRMRLDDQIETAVESVLTQTAWAGRGVMLSVAVRTLSGHRLYPPVYREAGISEPKIDPMQIASENFMLLNEGLDIALSVTIGHNTFVANSVLGLAVLVALTGLLALYQRGNRVLARDEARRRQEAEKIRVREKEQQAALVTLESQKTDLITEIAAVQAQLEAVHERAAQNEADLFEEVEALEKKLQQHLHHQEQQQSRIADLEEHLVRLAKEREALASQQNKVAGGLRKRMETLYKNSSFSDRALSSLAELPEPLQIKAEEIIHQLNAQADEVTVKRKLFRGKGKETVFEIVFARKGRLYFRRTRDRKTDILAIGTKNTQDKDLIYLDRVL